MLIQQLSTLPVVLQVKFLIFIDFIEQPIDYLSIQFSFALLLFPLDSQPILQCHPYVQEIHGTKQLYDGQEVEDWVDAWDFDHLDHLFFLFVECEVDAAADDENNLNGYGQDGYAESVVVEGLTGLTQTVKHFVVPGHLVVDLLWFWKEIGNFVNLGVSLHILMDVVGGLAADLVEDWQLGEV